MDLNYSRIQFTPDLMLADILGTNMIVEDENGRRGFEFQRGPVFTQILLADEINRLLQDSICHAGNHAGRNGNGGRYAIRSRKALLRTCDAESD